jgi:MFS family permease
MPVMRTPHPATPVLSWLMLAGLAVAEFLGMTLWFSATAAATAIVQEFHLSQAQASWLTMAVQGGFVAGTLVSALANLPDVLNARRLFALGCLLGAAANLGVTRVADPAGMIALRFLTGASLAWVYPTGMKIAASWFDRRRGTALGVLIAALTLGKAFPHLLTWIVGGASWRTEMGMVSALAVGGGLLVVGLVRDGPHLAATAPFDPHAAIGVFRNRRTRLATLGYFGHMWELYAMWSWVAVFAAASLSVQGGRTASGSMAGFLGIGAGAVGCVVAGLAADRLGKARVARWAMLTSAGCAALAGVVFGQPRAILYALVAAWGFSVVADSAQFSALVSEYSPRQHVGTALTVQTCGGFLLTMVSIWLVPVVAGAIGWQWVFVFLAPGPLLGAWAMRRLDRLTAGEPDGHYSTGLSGMPGAR